MRDQYRRSVQTKGKDTVTTNEEHNEVYTDDDAGLLDAAIRPDPVVHHHVPVLTSQDLKHGDHNQSSITFKYSIPKKITLCLTFKGGFILQTYLTLANQPLSTCFAAVLKY